VPPAERSSIKPKIIQFLSTAMAVLRCFVLVAFANGKFSLFAMCTYCISVNLCLFEISSPTPAVQPPAWVGRSVASVCLFVCLFVCAHFELSAPNVVRMYSITVARYALTQRSKGQTSRSHG